MSHGDFATNAALVAAKQLGQNPRDVALALTQKMHGSLKGVERTEVAGPGFINFFLTKDAIVGEIEKVAQGAQPNIASDVAGMNVMVEFTDPNPFKEFHIGHLMSNTIGEAISRVLEAAGASVSRVNYQGDVGLHVAKALYVLLVQGIEEPTIGDISAAYVEGSKLYEEDAEAKLQIDVLNKTIYEKSDEKVNELYKKGRILSLKHFEELYQMLGTEFSRFYFESETSGPGLALVASHASDVFEASDGAIVYHGEKVGLHTRVFINRQGLPTYEAKDLGLLELKAKENPDLSITVTASEQSEYFKVVLAAARELPEVADIAGKTQHVAHGMMRFAEGKMSSRRGNVITGESLLQDLIAESKDKMGGRELREPAKVAQQVAVGAIKYAVLKQGSGKDIIFNPEQSLSLEGDSGPYLQYAHTRARSLLKAAHAIDIVPGVDGAREPGELERTLIHFPSVLERAARELEPHYITTYLTELASTFNSWYASERVIGGPNPGYGVLLTEAFANTMRQGLHVLGIPTRGDVKKEPPEEM
jgi:arginyl-tRNA synthetase